MRASDQRDREGGRKWQLGYRPPLPNPSPARGEGFEIGGLC